MSGPALRNGRGCLTEAGVRAVARAPLGQAPPELASHVAACARCQDRMLASLRTPAEAGRPRREAPPRWRTWALLAAGLLLLAAALLVGRCLKRG